MKRLTAYLARLFATDALTLFSIVCLLLWLVNCLRSFEVVSVKGQNALILAWQALLTMPQLAISFFYVCVGIGLVRAMNALQANHELHIIHTCHGLKSLRNAAAVVAIAGVVGVLFLSNFVEPYANRHLNLLNAHIAADMVSSSLKPGLFTQVTPGVLLLIGARGSDSEIIGFFADDRRDAQIRRTYIAESAKVATDGNAYIIELRNGALQNSDISGRFSEISFTRYDINVEKLAQSAGQAEPMIEEDSVQLVLEALSSGNWHESLVMMLANRLAEGLRVIGIVTMVMAMTAFPGGRRTRIQLPLEAVILLIAFLERGFSAYSPLGTTTGALAMIFAGGTILLWRGWERNAPVAVAP